MQPIILFSLFQRKAKKPAKPVAKKQVVKLMGSRFEITMVAADAKKASNHIKIAIAEIQRIEDLISEFKPESEVSKINEKAGIEPVKVSLEVFGLVERALRFSKITNGAFDISAASMSRIWRFDGTMNEVPPKEAIQNSIQNINYNNIILNRDEQTIFLKNPGMCIGFGSIGKGYAADKTKELMVGLGVTSGIINAAGDMSSWGKQPNGNSWKVAITNPLNNNNAFAFFPLQNGAVATSGDYEKFLMINNIRYSHIIDPKSGYPAAGISSVTIFAKSAELANGLSTSIMVMGIETGLDLINQIPNIDAVIVDNLGKIHYSNDIKIQHP